MIQEILYLPPLERSVPMNDLIVKRVKEARLEKGFTQQDIANHLGKTSAAISDLERGKVQVTASDLYQISQLLKKPIEFFYGEEYGEKEIQDLIAIIHKKTPETRAKSIATMTMILQMFEIGERLTGNPEKEPTIEELKEFFTKFITFAKEINDTTVQVNFFRDKIIQELKSQGIDITR